MKLLFIFGAAAVGKMTVGQELTKITDFRLFHNHASIEPVLEVFGKFDMNVISKVRDVIFEEFAKTDNYGLMFTMMMDFDMQDDWDYLEHVKSYFLNEEIYYVELTAPQEVRLQRNVTQNRLDNKPSKRDIEISNKRLVADDERYRLETHDGEFSFDNYIKIDTTNCSAVETAEMIKEKFGF